MAISKYMLGVKGDECQCGRRQTVRHCTQCGSTHIYSRQHRPHLFESGVTKYVDIEFRCQRCSHLFIEGDREFCNAPPVGPKLAAQRVKVLAEAGILGDVPKSVKDLFDQPNTPQQATPQTPQTPEQRDRWIRDQRYMVATEWLAMPEANRPSRTEYLTRRHKELGLPPLEEEPVEDEEPKEG